MRAGAAGILLDFDGSLARIVARPELAVPVAGAREAVEALMRVYRLVAVVSGRRSEDVAALLGVEGVRYEGLYGMEGAGAEPTAALLSDAEAAASEVPEAWVENKRASVAVHYRQASDPVIARAKLITALQPVATAAGMELVEGKMVVELVPAGRPLKGGAVERLVRGSGLEAALYAGDDVADLDAFAALDRMAAEGLVAVKVAVQGVETPAALLKASDLVVDGPEGLVELLRGLA